MRRLAVLLAVAAALIAGCGGNTSRHARLWLTPAHTHVYTACVSQDCGPWQVTLNWMLPQFPGTTGYYTFLNGVQQADVSQGPFTYGGWDCGTTVTLGVKAHNGSGQASPLYTIDYTTPACAITDPALFHVAQTSAGTADGSSCANAQAVSTLSTATHWTAGNVIGLCGTITSSITAQASGTNGSPITVYWESGASISEPACPNYSSNQACFNTNGQTYLTLNGGVNGSILSTANGSGQANADADSTGIRALGCTGCTVENLNVSNMYTAVPGGGTTCTCGQAGTNCGGGNDVGIIFGAASNFTLSNNTFSDETAGGDWNPGATDTNVTMTGNTFHQDGTGMVWISSTNGGGSIGPVLFANNTLDGFSLWNTTADCYHEDGIHCWDSPGFTPVHYNGAYIYDNRWSGMGGPTTTGYIFLEGGPGGGTTCADTTSDFWIFNNVLTSTAGLGNGLLEPTSSKPHVLNNTANGNDTSAGACVDWNQSTIGPGDVENNVFTSCSVLIYDSNSQPFGTIDFNTYANAGGGWRWGATTPAFTAGGFATWKADVGGDGHSVMAASANLNSDGSLQAGSPAIGEGTNLTSLCTGSLTPLCTGIGGAARPALGAWDAGAY